MAGLQSSLVSSPVRLYKTSRFRADEQVLEHETTTVVWDTGSTGHTWSRTSCMMISFPSCLSDLGCMYCCVFALHVLPLLRSPRFLPRRAKDT